MKPLYRNFLLVVGLIALAITGYMVEVPAGVNWRLAAVYLPAVILIWGAVYCLNTLAFKLITNTVSENSYLSFLKSFKLTVSAFALTFITPFGFGGGPYRVMEMSRYIGTPRAISSVTLYSLMHILGHFILWFTCVIVFLIFYSEKVTPALLTPCIIFMVVFVAVLVVFNWFYTNGLLERLFKLFFFVPGIKGWARRFHEKHYDAFHLADECVMLLKQKRRTFWATILCEYLGRLLSAWEFWFILAAFGMSHVTYGDVLLVIGFSSLVGNVLYLLPLQLGAREGGLAVILHILYGTTANVGLFVSFYTRIAELFWVAVGIVLVKVANKRLMR